MQGQKDQQSVASRKKNEEHKSALNVPERRHDKAYEDYKSGLIDSVALMRLGSKVRAEKERLEDRIKNKKQAATTSSQQTFQNLLELCNNSKSKWEELDDAEKVRLLKRICSNPVFEGGRLQYELK